jgi:hypothetical protein
LWQTIEPQAQGSGASGSGGGGGGGGGNVTTDKVSITRALWSAAVAHILVQATSSRQDAVLKLSDTTTGEFISVLPNIGGGRYGGTVIYWPKTLTSVTVTSNFGGTASRNVIAFQ